MCFSLFRIQLEEVQASPSYVLLTRQRFKDEMTMQPASTMGKTVDIVKYAEGVTTSGMSIPHRPPGRKHISRHDKTAWETNKQLTQDHVRLPHQFKTKRLVQPKPGQLIHGVDLAKPTWPVVTRDTARTTPKVGKLVQPNMEAYDKLDILTRLKIIREVVIKKRKWMENRLKVMKRDRKLSSSSG